MINLNRGTSVITKDRCVQWGYDPLIILRATD